MDPIGRRTRTGKALKGRIGAVEEGSDGLVVGFGQPFGVELFHDVPKPGEKDLSAFAPLLEVRVFGELLEGGDAVPDARNIFFFVFQEEIIDLESPLPIPLLSGEHAAEREHPADMGPGRMDRTFFLAVFLFLQEGALALPDVFEHRYGKMRISSDMEGDKLSAEIRGRDFEKPGGFENVVRVEHDLDVPAAFPAHGALEGDLRFLGEEFEASVIILAEDVFLCVT